jgi:hypothetical protein
MTFMHNIGNDAEVRMSTRKQRFWIMAGVTAAAMMASTAGLAAQAAGRGAQPAAVLTGDPTLRDITVPDTVPNISGTWQPQTYFRTIRPLDGSETPFLPWARDFFMERSEAEARGEPLFDPNANCLPSGVPRVLPTPYPYDIVQTPDAIYVSIEVMHSYRIIHMDGKPMPADFKPSYLGYSRGHWENDTLVIETTGLNGITQVDEEGRPKSSAMKVTERWTRKAPDLLENTFTLEDPRTFTRIWTSRAEYKWTPDLRFGEYICEENNRNKPDAAGRLRLR